MSWWIGMGAVVGEVIGGLAIFSVDMFMRRKRRRLPKARIG